MLNPVLFPVKILNANVWQHFCRDLQLVDGAICRTGLFVFENGTTFHNHHSPKQFQITVFFVFCASTFLTSDEKMSDRASA